MFSIAVTSDTGYAHALHFSERRLRHYTSLAPKVIVIAGQYSPERRRVEAFIGDTFRDSYGATITRHYPILMSVRDAEDRILGALGFRFARDETLFLEQYLSGDIANCHAQATGDAVPRSAFVESGNLASLGNGASIFLFTGMFAYLLQHGFSTIAVTATDFLHRYFLRLGLKPNVLGPADQSLLPDHGASWGSYYDTNPRVITGDMRDTYNRLKRHLHVEFSGEVEALHTRLHPAIEIQ